MKIEGKELHIEIHYLGLVTYIPSHAEGNAGHEGSEQGVIISINKKTQTVGVLYCKSRTVQVTNPEDLVWG